MIWLLSVEQIDTNSDILSYKNNRQSSSKSTAYIISTTFNNIDKRAIWMCLLNRNRFINFSCVEMSNELIEQIISNQL